MLEIKKLKEHFMKKTLCFILMIFALNSFAGTENVMTTTQKGTWEGTVNVTIEDGTTHSTKVIIKSHSTANAYWVNTSAFAGKSHNTDIIIITDIDEAGACKSLERFNYGDGTCINDSINLNYSYKSKDYEIKRSNKLTFSGDDLIYSSSSFENDRSDGVDLIDSRSVTGRLKKISNTGR
jgi:hypothetical protein